MQLTREWLSVLFMFTLNAVKVVCVKSASTLVVEDVFEECNHHSMGVGSDSEDMSISMSDLVIRPCNHQTCESNTSPTL